MCLLVFFVQINTHISSSLWLAHDNFFLSDSFVVLFGFARSPELLKSLMLNQRRDVLLVVLVDRNIIHHDMRIVLPTSAVDHTANKDDGVISLLFDDGCPFFSMLLLCALLVSMLLRSVSCGGEVIDWNRPTTEVSGVSDSLGDYMAAGLMVNARANPRV